MTRWLACVASFAVTFGGTFADSQPRETQEEPVRQRLVSFEDMAYPPIPRAAREQGIVVVDLRLDDSGVPVSAFALTGPALLIPDATANAKKWRFEPSAQRRAILVYEFSIGPGHCHDRSQSLFLLRRPNFAEIRSCENILEGRVSQPAEKR
jgi:hypothetical protein